MNTSNREEGALDDLVRAAANGDDHAFAEIFHRYHGRVWRAAYARLGNTADADDATSDTFIRLNRSIGRYRKLPDASFTAYVLRMADRAALDQYRRRARHPATPLATEPAVLDSPPDTARGWALHAAFAKLSASDRELLVLRVIDGRSSDEVATLLGRNPVAVRVAQHRALSRLRTLLEEVDDGS